MRSQCISRLRLHLLLADDRDVVLGDARDTHAMQPVQAFMSIAMPHCWPRYSLSAIERDALAELAPCSISLTNAGFALNSSSVAERTMLRPSIDQ